MSQDKRTLPLDLLLSYLPTEQAREYQLYRHTRVDVVKAGDEYIAYEFTGNGPKIVQRLEVDDIAIDDRGLVIHLGVTNTDEGIEITSMPRKPAGLPVFMFIPLNPGLRFDPTPASLEAGVLHAPVVIRTRSRLHKRERGVIHLEKREDYEKEFGAV